MKAGTSAAAAAAWKVTPSPLRVRGDMRTLAAYLSVGRNEDRSIGQTRARSARCQSASARGQHFRFGITHPLASCWLLSVSVRHVRALIGSAPEARHRFSPVLWSVVP